VVNFLDKKHKTEALEVEVETLKRVNEFAMNMYEPLQRDEIVACYAHIDELDEELIKAPKFEL